MKYRKHIRLKDYDYSSSGAYFVTICTNFKKKLIGEKAQNIIQQELKALEGRFEGVKVDYYVIMDNHLHLIFIFNDAKATLPRVIQVFKSITTMKLKREGYPEKTFWQKNYYEHVIKDERSLDKVREYIQNNPLVEELFWDDIYQD